MADEEVQDQQTEEGGADAESTTEKSLQDKLKEAIDVRVEEVGTLRKKLSITVPRDAIDARFDEQYEELRREALVPGFRKGRAPRRLLEKRFGHEVGETLVQQFVTNGYMAAIEKVDLKVLGDPLIWVTEKGATSQMLVDVQKAIDLLEVPKDGAFTFSCEVEVRPEFEMPELDGIPVTKPVVEITDEKLDAQMDRLRGMLGTYVPAPDGVAKADDVITGDLKMICGDTVLKEEQNVRIAVRPQVIDGVVLEKLGEVLTGAKVEEVKTISGQIPDTHIREEFRGKQADFTITARQIQRMELPELNEELAKHFGADSVAELRESVKADMESRIGEQVRQAMSEQICQYLIDKTSFDLPERLSEKQINQVTMRRMLELYQQGAPPAEVEKILDELKTKARADAVTSMKLAFVFEKLAEQFEDDVEVGEEEINAQIMAIARRQGRRFDRVRDELIKQDAVGNLYLRIRDDKIVAKLLEKATITEGKTQDETADKKKSGGKAKAETEAAPAGEAEESAAKPKRTPPKKSRKASDDAADAT